LGTTTPKPLPAARLKAATVNPPLTRPSPTLTHAVPPPPKLPAPALGDRSTTERDDRLDKAMRETDAITAVDIDAEAKAAERASQQLLARSDTHVRGGDAEGPRETGTLRSAVPPMMESSAANEPPPAQRETTPAPTSAPAAAAAPGPTAAASRGGPSEQPSVPISTAPATLPPPKTTELVTTGPTPACPQCEAPMQWVDEHLRFYCKLCRMYF
jgi:hypothetical protein